MDLTVTRVLESLKRLALESNGTLSSLKLTQHQVLDTTGPAMLTACAFEYITRTSGYNFTNANLTGLTEATLFGDVLILPINAFGTGQGHSGSGHPEDETALIQHMFKGSWKDSHKDKTEEEKAEEEHIDLEQVHKQLEEAHKALEEVHKEHEKEKEEKAEEQEEQEQVWPPSGS